ncbi:DUF896 family protein [Aerococcaceae bacterium DSM 109653]|uniref:UPF0291 protein GIY09_03150 n=1 Tax=Fundicoccus ignavus TaxID=2664442 RepID=A0A6I2GJY9_9LACT|nr:DUF896 family protein [Fundicoccus ignavus]MRI80664.1 DUF896 family protein [Fundicoccus ignavus]MRI84898.1 DUF896 family protein [Fundicoccus ignavus]
MLEKDKIERINQLARKKKAEGLNEAELAEQKALREEYIENLRFGMRNHIEGIKVVDEDGTDVTPDKVKNIQKDRKLHGRHLQHYFDQNKKD